MAIAALILGIVSLTLGLCFWAWPVSLIGLVGGILAVVFGNIARNDPSHPNMASIGRKLGVAGIVVGAICFVIGLILAVTGVIGNIIGTYSNLLGL